MSLEGITNQRANRFEIIYSSETPKGAFKQMSNAAGVSEAEPPSSAPPLPGWPIPDRLGVGVWAVFFYSSLKKNSLHFYMS